MQSIVVNRIIIDLDILIYLNAFLQNMFNSSDDDIPNDDDMHIIDKASKRTESLVLDKTKLKRITTILDQEFTKGLKDEENAAIKMLITYVRNLPKGDEKGKYLALDLGGTNFRVLMINLNEDNDVNMISDTFEIEKHLMTGEGNALFDYIAKCLIDFVVKHKLEHKRIGLGFTFSFPCTQYGLSQSKLVSWTKGFNCANVVGRDIVKLLKDALKRRMHRANAYIDIVAVINDTTGTLMSCAHKNKECRIGLIVGTGCNACYLENLEKIEKWPSNYTIPKQVIINTEWGAFGDNNVLSFIKTEWDTILDNDSINKGKQTYEKMISGMYIGEIVRLVLVTLINEKLLFGGKFPRKLREKNSFEAKFVSKIDSDDDQYKFQGVRHTMQKNFNCANLSDTDCKIIFMVNNRVSRRAAYLVAVGCATLLTRIDRDHTTIAYDGSVLRYHPYFRTWVTEKTKQLIDPKYKFDLMLSEDGSGRGAAIVAAVSYKEKRPKIIKRNGKCYEIYTYRL